MDFRLSVLIALSLFFSFQSVRQQGASPDQTHPLYEVSKGSHMSVAKQPDAPLRIENALFGNEAILKSGKLKNSGKSEIVSYRLGWIVLAGEKPLKVAKIQMGSMVAVPNGIAPGAVAEVQPQWVDDFGGGDSWLMFFVAEAKTRDGKMFRADTKTVENEAAEEFN